VRFIEISARLEADVLHNALIHGRLDENLLFLRLQGYDNVNVHRFLGQ
jgi:hypothetical protein